MSHVHPCPSCHEDIECALPEQVTDGFDLAGHPIVVIDGCTIEPDLETDDGTPSGSYVTCGACVGAKP